MRIVLLSVLLLILVHSRKKIASAHEIKEQGPTLKEQLDQHIEYHSQLAHHLATTYLLPCYQSIRTNNRMAFSLLVLICLYLLSSLYSCLFGRSCLKTNWNLQPQSQDDLDRFNTELKTLHDSLLAALSSPSNSSQDFLQRQLEQQQDIAQLRDKIQKFNQFQGNFQESILGFQKEMLKEIALIKAQLMENQKCEEAKDKDFV